MAGQILARFVRLVDRANETIRCGVAWLTLLMVLVAFAVLGIAQDAFNLDLLGGLPFVAIQIVGLILIAAFPSPATWLPQALFN